MTSAANPMTTGPRPLRGWTRARCGLVCAVLLALLTGSGCSSLMTSASAHLSRNLGTALANNDDPETVRDGAPSYLLLIDGLIEGSPDSPDLLRQGAKLYASYAAVFVDDPARAKRLATKARDYGWRALCAEEPRTCESWGRPFEEFDQVVSSLGADDVPALFDCAVAWAVWVRANREDWVAVADKARVEAMMQRVVALDERYERGAPHLYLGVLNTLLPAALGGKPEQGRQHFERAIELAGGRDLMAKTLLARDYARLVFDRELHDRLCTEVVEADPKEPGLTLTNVLAVRLAHELLAGADEYFGE